MRPSVSVHSYSSLYFRTYSPLWVNSSDECRGTGAKACVVLWGFLGMSGWSGGVILCQRSLHSRMQLICQRGPHRHGTAYSFFFPILAKQRGEISNHTSLLQKKDFLHSKIYHHNPPAPQVDVYSCLHWKGGTLRALDTFPKQRCISEKQQALKSQSVCQWFVLTHHSRDSKPGFSSSSKDTLKPWRKSRESHQTHRSFYLSSKALANSNLHRSADFRLALVTRNRQPKSWFQHELHESEASVHTFFLL